MKIVVVAVEAAISRNVRNSPVSSLSTPLGSGSAPPRASSGASSVSITTSFNRCARSRAVQRRVVGAAPLAVLQGDVESTGESLRLLVPHEGQRHGQVPQRVVLDRSATGEEGLRGRRT